MASKTIAVLGFGSTGMAVLDFLLQQKNDHTIMLYNDVPITDVQRRAAYEQQGVRFQIGSDQFKTLLDAQQVIMSPGIDGRAERFKPLRQKGVEILSEIELAARQIVSPIMAITGTNGKSTTVSLAHHFVSAGNERAILAGNIGIPFISQVSQVTAATIVVLEVSSFQLEEIAQFRPRIGALLNITPDHLDRYPDMAAYSQAKMNLFAWQTGSDAAIFNADDPLLPTYIERRGAARPYYFSLRHLPENGATIQGNELVLALDGQLERIALANNPLKGRHNLENIMAAALAARLMGISPLAIEDSLATFRGLPHRMEAVGRIGNVEFINDSKATNVDAALKAIGGVDGPLVVILGGKDKGSSYLPLHDVLAAKAHTILLIGKAAPVIYEELADLRGRMRQVTGLAEAVQDGYQLLRQTGGIVLLAPACASFDMFRNFEHRGDTFAAAVADLQSKVQHG